MASADKSLQNALVALNERRFPEAERLLRKVLSREPSQIGALNLLTVALMSMGRFAEAEPFITRAVKLHPHSDASFVNYGLILKHLRRPSEALAQLDAALRLNPKLAETWNTRGTVLSDLGRYQDAIGDFTRALSIKPQFPEALCNQGRALGALGRRDDALAAYDKAIGTNPGLLPAWLARAETLFLLGKADEALTACDRALSIDPNSAEAWLARSNVLAALSRNDEAWTAVEKALTIRKDLPEAWIARGNLALHFKRHDEAAAAFSTAIAQRDDLAEAWLGRANVLYEMMRDQEALQAYDKALSMKSEMPGAWLGRASVLARLKRYDEAFEHFDRAFALGATPAEVWLGRAAAFSDLRRMDEAFAAYDNAIEADPTHVEPHWNKALNKLWLGDFADGWDAYEFRLSNKDSDALQARSKVLNPQSRLERSAIEKQDVLVIAEQGIGDEIMFASIIPDLMKDANSIVYNVEPRLGRLIEEAFPGVRAVPTGSEELPSLAASRLVIYAGSLGYAYRRDRSAFSGEPYLKAAPERVARWKDILAREAGGRATIGLSWRGGTAKTRRNDRSVDLQMLSSVIGRDDCCFVNLQYGDVGNELEEFNSANPRHPILRPLNDVNDFDEFAALITALDLVISVQNTTIHMCGALGKTCWGMLPWRAEWRYGAEGETMVWYRSVRLHRQDAPGEWDHVIASIKTSLARFLDGRTND